MIRILVVDDSKAVHGFLTSCFKNTDHQLDHAYNGDEGWKKLSELKSGENAYGAVLLDWEMPVMNGPELLKKLRENQVTLPIIMMTTKNSASDISEMLNAGAAEYIMKPFTPDIVFEKIETVTGVKVTQP